MASTDLENFFKIIRTESSGEAVRDAIINSAKIIRTAANNSATLGGIDASLFAIRDEYDKLVSKMYDKVKYDTVETWDDDQYVVNSENIMTSGNLYELLEQYLRPALSSVMHYEIDPYTDNETKSAINNYLKNIQKAKDDMFTAIQAKTNIKSVSNTTAGTSGSTAAPVIQGYILFRDFGEIIRHLDDTTPKLESGRFTKNDTYDAGKGTTEYRAYESIEVNLSDSELKVSGSSSENHTTKYPPEGKLFGSFNVNVANASQARYASSSSRTGGVAGENVDDNGMLDVKEIVENGNYSAASETLTGYKTVTVMVTEPKVSGEFTVTFVNGADELLSISVPAYGNAKYTGDVPVNNDDPSQEFYGWYPVPDRVIENMTCQALFRPATKIVDTAEIQDDWATIVQKTGRSYNVGDYKSLEIGTVSNVNYGTLIMQKVADWGNGAIWCSKTILPTTQLGGGMTAWPTSAPRRFLNNDFLDIMAASSDGQIVVDNLIPHDIITMNAFTNWKHCDITSVYGHYNTMCEMTTTDKVWVPSIYEMAELSSSEVINLEKANLENNTWSLLYGFEQHGQSYSLLKAFGCPPSLITDPTYTNRGPYPSLNSSAFPGGESPLKKYMATNTSLNRGYTLRTVKSYGHGTHSETLLYNYWSINMTGTEYDHGDSNYAICFSI